MEPNEQSLPGQPLSLSSHSPSPRTVTAGKFKWTLLWLLLFVGTLAALLWPRPVCSMRTAISGKVRFDIVSIYYAVEEYAIDNGGRYPNDLRALVAPDEHGNTYLEGGTVPKDPWKREYCYEPPTVERPRPHIVCFGKDGLPGGEGDDADTDELFYLELGER